MTSRIVVVLLMIAINAPPLFAQQADSIAKLRARDSLFRANAHRGALSGAILTGDAAAFVLREARASQFVVVGERHGIKEIPEFVGWMLAELHRDGFNYLATENGALVTELAVNAAAQRNADSIISYASKYQNAFEFNSDQDLQLLGYAAQFLGGRRPVWGLDQEFGAAHLLDRLRKLPAPNAARSAADSLFQVVAAAEKRRVGNGGTHWMATESRPEMFDRLLALYGLAASGEEHRILDQLHESSRLYDLNRRVQGGEVVGFTANDDRESLLKRNFVSYYNEARLHGLPKVLLKMGQAHAGKGQGPFGPFTIGNLVADIATENNTKSFHLLVLAHNAQADSTAPGLWKWPDMRPLAETTPIGGVTVIDLRPLRSQLYANRLGRIDPDLRRTIYGFDAIMLIGGATLATEKLTTQ